ncbi:MAG: hypothetical protein EOO92_03985 [Pedobacter sp.]|nr:MAG: hypothetical protein EOO92_03985 [Pedobacter sp.]
MIYLGAEIFIERGQTAEEIDLWFRSMRDYGLGLTRIRMFENYMHLEDGSWDFSLFDIAFIAAEKYGIKIYANLFPATDFSDVGGFKFPKSEENFASIGGYTKAVVEHFIGFKSLYGWVPVNEPGAGQLPADSFTQNKFEEWKQQQIADSKSHGFTTFGFDEERFLLDYNTWFLEWLCLEIRKYDPVNPIHVNNHDIFRNVAEYDFPKWRSFLTSLGGSAHASWHFDYFNRAQYALGMSANAEIIRSGAGDLPWFMTELQGGNNTYSGRQPMCPTKEEIAQWIWINIGSGSEGAMFWCLNPRRSGFEAGEWAMLDFINEPTDRLLTAASISDVLNKHSDLFEDIQVADSEISVLYTRESLWIEKKLQIEGAFLDGRSVGGVMKSALAYFEALSEMGIHAAFKEIGEYNFNRDNFHDQVIILSHQVSIPSKYWLQLNNFVNKGGKLIVDGLTAYYDESAYLIHGAKFPFKESFGASIKEYRLIDKFFQLKFKEQGLSATAHLWQGYLTLHTAEPMVEINGEVLACKNQYGDGSVLWIPALLGLGGRLTNYTALATLLTKECENVITKIPIRFAAHYPGLLIKVLKTGEVYITIIVNKSAEDVLVSLESIDLEISAIIFSMFLKEKPLKDAVLLAKEETLVLKWA